MAGSKGVHGGLETCASFACYHPPVGAWSLQTWCPNRIDRASFPQTPQKVLKSTQLHTTSTQMHPRTRRSKPLRLKTPREIRPLHAVTTHLASSRTLHDQEQARRNHSASTTRCTAARNTLRCARMTGSCWTPDAEPRDFSTALSPTSFVRSQPEKRNQKKSQTNHIKPGRHSRNAEAKLIAAPLHSSPKSSLQHLSNIK